MLAMLTDRPNLVEYEFHESEDSVNILSLYSL